MATNFSLFIRKIPVSQGAELNELDAGVVFASDVLGVSWAKQFEPASKSVLNQANGGNFMVSPCRNDCQDLRRCRSGQSAPCDEPQNWMVQTTSDGVSRSKHSASHTDGPS